VVICRGRRLDDRDIKALSATRDEGLRPGRGSLCSWGPEDQSSEATEGKN